MWSNYRSSLSSALINFRANHLLRISSLQQMEVELPSCWHLQACSMDARNFTIFHGDSLFLVPVVEVARDGESRLGIIHFNLAAFVHHIPPQRFIALIRTHGKAELMTSAKHSGVRKVGLPFVIVQTHGPHFRWRSRQQFFHPNFFHILLDRHVLSPEDAMSIRSSESEGGNLGIPLVCCESQGLRFEVGIEHGMLQVWIQGPQVLCWCALGVAALHDAFHNSTHRSTTFQVPNVGLC
mmetsp:Transcript_11152/g.13923  ORF Transcript_11152/g.13923 Transcript_11152/m.13923 type:complete len:238 (-) Transcript_11152:2007-2720(-)